MSSYNVELLNWLGGDWRGVEIYPHIQSMIPQLNPKTRIVFVDNFIVNVPVEAPPKPHRITVKKPGLTARLQRAAGELLGSEALAKRGVMPGIEAQKLRYTQLTLETYAIRTSQYETARITMGYHAAADTLYIRGTGDTRLDFWSGLPKLKNL